MALYDVSTNEKKVSPSLVAGGTLYADVGIGTILPFGGTSDKIPQGYLLCDGTSLLRASYPELFAVIGTAFGSADSTHFNIPDMTGKTTMGVETGHALGTSSAGALPNITGGRNNTLSDMIWMGDAISQGSIQHGTPESEYQIPSGGTWGRFAPLLFDASVSSNLYKNNQSYVEPANVRVNYIIKAKMVAMPSDFMSKVDEAVEEANTPVSITITIDSTSGTFLKLTKVGNMVFGQISATTSNNLTITDSQILAAIPETYRTTNEVRFHVLARTSGQYAIFRYFNNSSQLQVDTKGTGILTVPAANFSYVIE